MRDNHIHSAREPMAADKHVLPPSWQGLKQQVIYLAQFGGGVQVVEGSAGAGKTTFAAWLHQDPAALSLSLVEVADHPGGQELFLELLRQLGLRPQPSAGLGELLVMLRSYVQSLHRDSSRAVLLLDDAHLIADADLAALMSVMQGGSDSGFGLHLIMVAEPGLTARIDQLQLLDVVVHDMVIPALSAAEVQSLLSQSPVDGVDPSNAQPLWHQSGGNPGKLMAALRQSQPQSHVDEAAEPPARQADNTSARTWPKAHVAAIAFLLCVLIWAFVSQKDDEQPIVTTVDVSELIARPPEPQNKPASSGVPADGARAVTVESEQPATELELMAEQDAPAVDSVDSVDVVPVGVQTQEQIAIDPVREVQPQSEKPEAQPVVPEPQPAAQPAATVAAPDLVSRSEKQLLAYPGHAYVLQLMASAAPETLLDFVAAQPNRDHLLVYRARRDGKLLHILVEGFYADKPAATAAITNLPPAQRKSGPWPKRIEHIHRDIGADGAR